MLDLLSLLDVSLRSHSFYKRLENKARAEIRLRINMPAPDFSIVASAHDTFMLSKLKGKYVLLDFWASWCAPCRSANQHLKKMQQTYKNKGFEVVSFSIDEKEKEWKKAVDRDIINWISLIDYAGWKSKTAVLYDVQTIPASFLIDPEGKIIAKNLSPEELEDKFKLLLK
jgi:thiol-disulfide isomerase/thioredoxin